MNIIPYDMPGDSRTGTLDDITIDAIVEVLGFEHNVQDDPDKVVNSWGFKVDGVQCAIWDYKGSHLHGSFSTFGPHEIFQQLFPAHYV
jgi:hypothetical protein